MSQRYVVIGSGPSGANAALTLLERGKEVTLYDVGAEESDFPFPTNRFHDLKGLLPDPYEFFLGKNHEALIAPQSGKIFEYPPSRNFLVQENESPLRLIPGRFKPFLSHSRGGLGIAWGANSLQYDDDDLKDFPIDARDLEEGYQIAGNRISISGPEEDDLSEFLPASRPHRPPLNLNLHEERLMKRYHRAKKRSPGEDWVRLGRARMAVETAPESPNRCIYCDRCLWGCGSSSIYNPKGTLALCRKYRQFRYKPNSFVTHFLVHEGSIRSIFIYDTAEKSRDEVPADVVILASGAIGSSIIFLRTLKNDPVFRDRFKESPPQTKSLLDTRVIKMPYLLLDMIGRHNDPGDFQFNKLILGILNRSHGTFPQYIHGEILSLSGLIYHPLIESLPFGSRLSTSLFGQLRCGLGVISLFLPDRPSPGNGIVLEPDESSVTDDRVKILYSDTTENLALGKAAVERTRKFFWKIGCYLSRNDIRFERPGNGIHYAGTVPMSKQRDILCSDKEGRSYAYPNLYFVDGSVFPTLPSKSITLSLMANAIRVAKGIS